MGEDFNRCDLCRAKLCGFSPPADLTPITALLPCLHAFCPTCKTRCEQGLVLLFNFMQFFLSIFLKNMKSQEKKLLKFRFGYSINESPNIGLPGLPYGMSPISCT